MYFIIADLFIDDTCVLLPKRQTVTLDRATRERIVGALVTRLVAVNPAIIRHAIPSEVDEWGKVRIVNGGDTMVAALVNSGAEDCRDATFVRVRWCSLRYLSLLESCPVNAGSKCSTHRERERGYAEPIGATSDRFAGSDRPDQLTGANVGRHKRQAYFRTVRYIGTMKVSTCSLQYR